MPKERSLPPGAGIVALLAGVALIADALYGVWRFWRLTVGLHVALGWYAWAGSVLPGGVFLVIASRSLRAGRRSGLWWIAAATCWVVAAWFMGSRGYFYVLRPYSPR